MKLSQTIRFCSSVEGTRIAVASCGKGQVILRAAQTPLNMVLEAS